MVQGFMRACNGPDVAPWAWPEPLLDRGRRRERKREEGKVSPCRVPSEQGVSARQ
jgi:hypothetical protein